MTYKESEDNNSSPVDWGKLVGEQARRLQLEKAAKEAIEKESHEKAVRFLREVGAIELLTQIRDQIWKAGTVITVIADRFGHGYNPSFWWAYKSEDELGYIPNNWTYDDLYRKQYKEREEPVGEACSALCLAWEEETWVGAGYGEKGHPGGPIIVQADDPIVIRCAYLGTEGKYAFGVARGGMKRYLNGNEALLSITRATAFGVVPDVERPEIGLNSTFFIPEEPNPRERLIKELAKKVLTTEDYSRKKETEVHSFSPVIKLYE